MPRKSVRLQKSRRRRESALEEEIIQTFSKKRKAEEELERTNEVTKRRRQFQQQNQWVPISIQQSTSTSASVSVATATTTTSPGKVTAPTTTEDVDLTKCTESSLGPSPQTVNNSTPTEFIIGSKFRLRNPLCLPLSLRHSPLPCLQWADSKEVWKVMLKKEQHYVRHPDLLDNHPSIQPKMRAILIDWLIEVCEVYRLHRESLYLAIDFFDRFLCVTKNIRKQQLQLVGISCLFVAAKLEEIYPPKLTEFAYVTDGACTDDEILEQELVILKALGWDLSPLTTNSWLNIFLQLVNVENIEEKESNFVFPQYSQHAFVQVARLLDLCFLDVGCLNHTYSVLATTALYHMSSEQMALSVSGYQWEDIACCVQWMAPFAMTLREVGSVELKYFSGIASENAHNIQTHAVDLSLLEKAQRRQAELISSSRASPDLSQELPGVITPPQSTKGKGKPNTPEKTPVKVPLVTPECDESNTSELST